MSAVVLQLFPRRFIRQRIFRSPGMGYTSDELLPIPKELERIMIHL